MDHVAHTKVCNNCRQSKEPFGNFETKTDGKQTDQMSTHRCHETSLIMGKKEKGKKCNFETKIDGKQRNRRNHESPCNKCDNDANTAGNQKNHVVTRQRPLFTETDCKST